jgi:hypothetical protein
MKNITKIYRGHFFILVLATLSNTVFGQETGDKQFKKQKI